MFLYVKFYEIWVTLCKLTNEDEEISAKHALNEWRLVTSLG